MLMSGNDAQLFTFVYEECKFLSQLDSLEFGTLKPEAPESTERRKLIEKAVHFFDSIIACAVLEIEKDRAKEESEVLIEAESGDREKDLSIIRHQVYEKYIDRFHKLIDPKVYLILGHFQLLLHRFDDALSAYLKYESICPESASKNCSFLYGFGLCSFRLNAFHRTCRVFQQILYLQPWFPKAKEIHIRLGYIYKIQGKFEQSLKHFRQALCDSAPATFSRIEIRFHVAHLFEVCNKAKQAVLEYQQLLDTDKAIVPNHIRHLCLRQLAWLHHTGACGPKSNAEKDLDVQWLQRALELDNTNGKTWYLLGRCQASLNRVQEAFAAYRSSIDKTEASADTWCSIGVLYQEQSQPMDALQAYFCAVQLDKCHVAAWANLGTLYESMQQYKEALKCYKNAVNADKNNELKPEIRSRLSVLQQIVPRLPDKLLSGPSPNPSATSSPGTPTGGTVTKLPTVDEAWSLPIPAELTQRQMQLTIQEATSATGDDKRDTKLFVDLHTVPSLASILKKRKVRNYSAMSNDSQQSNSDHVSDASVKRSRRENSPEVAPLTNQQMQMLQTLQIQETSLNASQRQLLTQLQNQALRYHQHRLIHGESTKPEDYTREAASSTSRSIALSDSVPENVDLFPSEEDGLPAVVGSPGGEHLPEEDLAFLTDDLLAQLNRAETAANLDLVELALFASTEQQQQQQQQRSANQTSTDGRGDHRRSAEDGNTTDLKPPASNLNPTDSRTEAVNSPMIDSDHVRQHNNEPVDLYAYLTRPLNQPASITESLSINMSAAEILKAVSGLGRSGGPWWPSILPEGSPIPGPPAKPYPPPTRDKLHPATPSVYLENRKDANSPDLMRYCFSQPCAVIRGLAVTLRMDLGLFSTKSLVEANPDHRIEVRTQMPQPTDVNRDAQGRTVWFCESPRTVTTLAKFAAYQARSFIDALEEEKLSLAPGSASSPHNGSGFGGSADMSSRRDSGEFKSNLFSPGSVHPNTPDSVKLTTRTSDPKSRSKVIRFGTNCDLSDEKKWLPQLHELTKLPSFFRVVSAFNMLSHVGYPLLGMNTVQLYLKVPGSRTPGHQENNCFCAVNMNIGPGDCEWFSVPEQYWGAIHDLCEKNNVDYLTGSWWPDLETLYKEEIPVYRFIQRPGDLVWINAGTVHWVQAIGWCNNIAWNVGPMTARQYQMAAERYEFNRLRGVKSIVPMIHFSWQLAKNVKISDRALYELIKQTLLRSLIQSQMATDFIKNLDLTIKRHGKRPDDVAHSCHDCEVEVFNLLFVISQDRKLVVRCLDCARRLDPTLRTFTILAEYDMHELSEIYDDFHLHTQSMTAYPVGKV